MCTYIQHTFSSTLQIADLSCPRNRRDKQIDAAFCLGAGEALARERGGERGRLSKEEEPNSY